MSKVVDIYQTLEDRGNYKEVICHGPFFCSATDERGIRKEGSKEPWLGEGYYFWEASIDNARWWGRVAYWKTSKGFIICRARYDRYSPLLFDLAGDMENNHDFCECARFLAEKRHIKRVPFPLVIGYLRKIGRFNYKAIRVWPMPKNTFEKSVVFFPGDKIFLPKMDKLQVCFFDADVNDSPKFGYRQ